MTECERCNAVDKIVIDQMYEIKNLKDLLKRSIETRANLAERLHGTPNKPNMHRCDCDYCLFGDEALPECIQEELFREIEEAIGEE